MHSITFDGAATNLAIAKYLHSLKKEKSDDEDLKEIDELDELDEFMNADDTEIFMYHFPHYFSHPRIKN